MVRFMISELEVFFPYDYVYPEQYEYMRYLKATLDAKGHCVLEMPTGTGKTVALMSLITSYQLAHPEVGKLIYCTRTVAEMEKALTELQTVIQYQLDALEQDSQKKKDVTNEANKIHFKESETSGLLSNTDSSESNPSLDINPQIEKSKRILGVGMASRRNFCIHPDVIQEANRDKIDEKCQALTAPWIRRKRLINSLLERKQKGIHPNSSSVPNDSTQDSQTHDLTTHSSTDIEDISNTSCNTCSNQPESSDQYTINNSTELGPIPTKCCPYYENYESLWSPSLMPSGVYSIDDLKKFGKSWIHPTKASTPAPFCPYFGARRLLQIANVIVLNYQYLLDPKVSQVAFMGGIGPTSVMSGSSYHSRSDTSHIKDPSIVVFDEAHNIDNVCIEAFSVHLNIMNLEKARQNIEMLEKELNKTKSVNASRLLVEYERLVQNLKDHGQLDDVAIETLASPILPDDIAKEAVPGTIRRAEFFLSTMKRLVLFLTTYIRVFTVKTEGPLTFLKNLKDETTIDTKTLKFCYERLKSLLNTLEVASLDDYAPLTIVADFFTLLGTYWEGFIIITDPYPEAEGIYDPIIQLSCLDSSLAMKPVLQKFQSVILTSGTISPLFLYPKLLGFQPVITQSLPMSLDRNCICPLIVSKGSDQVPLSSRFDLRSDQAVVRNFGTLLVELSKTVPDGIVCFFTSYAFMELIVSEWYHMGVLAEVMRHKLILMETKDVVATTLALHSYRRACDCGRGAVFFSVARGKVAEGIDFDRHYGRAVILFGVPYQYTLSRILKARLDFMRENYQVPENEFLTFDAMRQAAQCVGRVIRSKTDYGLMIFADSRYSRLDKRQKLPEWILRHLDPVHMGLSTDAALCIARKFLLDMSQPLCMTTKSRLDKTSLNRLEKQYKSQEKAIILSPSLCPNQYIKEEEKETEEKDLRLSAPVDIKSPENTMIQKEKISNGPLMK